MTQDELPRRWMAPGSFDLWGRDRTPYQVVRHGHYKNVPYDALPKLASTSEPFAWLRPCPARPRSEALSVWRDGDRLARPLPRMVEDIVAAARREGLTVPSPYVTFMNDPSLHERVPTCTGCGLDVPAKLVALPGGQPGRLLRFMNDSQCDVLWYLHLTVDGGCSVVSKRGGSMDGPCSADPVRLSFMPSHGGTCSGVRPRLVAHLLRDVVCPLRLRFGVD